MKLHYLILALLAAGLAHADRKAPVSEPEPTPTVEAQSEAPPAPEAQPLSPAVEKGLAWLAKTHQKGESLQYSLTLSGSDA